MRVIGHRDVPGRPELLATTRQFLDYFGLKSLDDLPTLAQLKDVESLGVQLELGQELTLEASDAQDPDGGTIEPETAESEDAAEPDTPGAPAG